MIRRLLFSIIKRETLISTRNFILSVQNSLKTTMDSLLLQNRASESSPDDQNQVLTIDPPIFNPLEPSVPISYPIKTLKELSSRVYYKSFHYPFNKSSVPLVTKMKKLPNRKRILVCHDMAGGYIDDKWVQGGENSEAYSNWHWYLMDIFVYFSHNLVTIPPPCWVNTAHTHGVKVLGTFIAEWDEGKLVCNELLVTKESARMYAERLSELAVALGFDGWLINIEVKLDVKQIPNMKEFVNHLTKTMHSSMPGSLVIWYDSVTIDGDLYWQDQLNEKNKPFFDLCDGIFVNYTWQEDYPKLSAEVAGERKYDVYMGIDIFGRNTFGGGQWTTYIALDVLKKDDVSAAIFAPGWAYETKEPPNFQTAENLWWGLVEKSWGVLQRYPTSLPFYSNFDQGHGYHFSVDGKQVSKDPWCNISCQTFQPVLESSEEFLLNPIQVTVDFKEASYNGGGSILAKGTLEGTSHFKARLFKAKLPMSDLPIHVTYSVRSHGNSKVGVSLVFSHNTNETKSVLLASPGDDLITFNQFASKFDKVIMPVAVTNLEADAQVGLGWVIQESSMEMNGYTLREIFMVCYRTKHKSRELNLEQDGKSKDTQLISASSEYSASLGHITIRTSEQKLTFPKSTSWVTKGKFVSWSKSRSEDSKSLNFRLSWKLTDEHGFQLSKYNIYVSEITKKIVGGKMQEVEGKREFLGVAAVQAYYVSSLSVSAGVSSLKFVIQAWGVDGSFQEFNSCPAFLLNVEGVPGINDKTNEPCIALLSGSGRCSKQNSSASVQSWSFKVKSFASTTVFKTQKWGGECWIWRTILKVIMVMKRLMSGGFDNDRGYSSLKLVHEKENWIREVFPIDMAEKIVHINSSANAVAGRLMWWPLERGATSYSSIESGKNEMTMENPREIP
ncbi:hypothetical protein C5167_021567 [Papaver somniferum]|uniref:cytosolic endo-beta-N-acetylglucosaminidase 1-like n=1 Tax=Papaver somniferum TaxID=3469 RepID=UPI000E6F5F42|nr:cytosolic endo-beta-N-acetylglucosaminidase 1-like [Papaver somniferum]RZC91856.1 hypothetical protein C5167_021567 [Papaver somniferum]